MEEGGPPTSLSFLEERMIDRAIIAQSTVMCRNPLRSGIYDEISEKSGLTKLRVNICGDDIVHCLMRK